MSGQPIAIDDLRNDPRFAKDVAEDTGYIPQALLAVPVVSPARLLGVMTLLDRDAARPGADQDMTLLSVFADQAALALEAARAFNHLGRVLLGA
ncbi:MAG: GAF domain-containing protein, partial [Actinomycetota bacterium]|nr:GAF domain-containing protein [Actinomycetota bacterium]